MNKRLIGLLPCVSIVCALALSCGNSDEPAGGGGRGGVAGSNSPGGTSGGGTAGLDAVGGAAGSEAGGSDSGAAGASDAGGSPGVGGSAGDEGGSVGGSGGDEGGAGGAAGAPVDTSPLSPSDIPDLALWLDANAQAFSDKDENFPVPADSGRVRSIPEPSPLTGSWQAPSPLERPIRALGAVDLRPVESTDGYGYYLQDTTGTIKTDDSTLAISYRTMNSNSAQGALTARIGDTSQVVGILFIGDIIGIRYASSLVFLKKHVARGLHTTMIIRFSPTGVNVQFDVEGFRSSESVVAPVDHATASNFLLGYDGNLKSSMYGFVSQVVGFNRAISDAETSRLMTWLHEQPIPDAFPVTKPLVAIVGDSIANGDQVPGWQSWGFRMLGNLADTHPDVQLLNDAVNGGGIPTVKNSTYSERVLPWYSAARAKNILIIAAGTNDLLSGTKKLQDILDRYYGLLNAARATGWKTVACTVLPRHDGVVDGPTGFEAARQAFNADLRAHSSSYDALADVAAITGLGAAGDADNTAYYAADKVHPNPAGHALLEPVYRAAVAGLL